MDGKVFVMQVESTAEIDSSALPRTLSFNESTLLGHVYTAGFGGASKADITNALANGWPEGTDLVSKLAEQMRGQLEKPKSFKRRQQWREDGDEPSWEREQAGHTEIWRTSRRETMRGPTTVELLGTWGGLSHVSADQLRWDGVVLAVLCDLLEEAGYRVGATLNNASRHGGSFYSRGRQENFTLIQITVKRPEMPLDIASMVPIAAFPGVFRWHGLEMKTLAPFQVDSGFGATIELEALPQIPTINPRAIKLHHAYSEQAAKQEIQRVLDLFKDTSAVSTYIP
jgi:hypothetical protein